MAPFRTGSLILPLLLIAACGAEEESNTPPPEPPLDFPAIVDSANVDHAAHQAWYESGWVAEAMNSQGPRGMDLPPPILGVARWATDIGNLPTHLDRPALSLISECVPVITGYNGAGDLIDTDGDGIPNDYKVDYGDACVSEIEGGVVRLTISGSRRLQDTNLGFRSFRVTTDDLVIFVEYVDTHVTHRLELSGTEEGSFEGVAAHYAETSTIKEHSFDPKAGIDDDQYRQIIESADFVPAAGQSLALHAPLPAGTLVYQGDLGHMDPFDPLLPTRLFYHFTMEATMALEYSPACNGGDFVGGVLRGTLNGGGETGFQLTWNGCADLPTHEFFGYQ